MGAHIHLEEGEVWLLCWAAEIGGWLTLGSGRWEPVCFVSKQQRCLYISSSKYFDEGSCIPRGFPNERGGSLQHWFHWEWICPLKTKICKPCPFWSIGKTRFVFLLNYGDHLETRIPVAAFGKLPMMSYISQGTGRSDAKGIGLRDFTFFLIVFVETHWQAAWFCFDILQKGRSGMPC